MKLYFVLVLMVISSLPVYSKWEQCNNGLNGGDVSVLFNDGNNIWVGSDYFGIFLSTDGGESWSKKTDFETGRVSSIFVSGKNIVFGCYNGIYFSSDDGENWKFVHSGYNYSTYMTLEERNGIIYTAINGDLLTSSDFGQTWHYRITYTENIYCLKFIDNLLYIGLNSGYAVSTDSGLTFTKYFLANNVSVNSIAKLGDTLFLGTQHSIFTTFDSLKSSQQGFPDNSNMPITKIVNYRDTIYVSNYNGIYFYDVKTKDWIRIKSTGNLQINCFLKNDSGYLIGANTGFYKGSADGLSAERKNNGLFACQINVLLNHGLDIYAGTNGAGLFYSSDSGNNWIECNAGLNNLFINSLASSDSLIYIGTSDGISVYNPATKISELLSLEYNRIDNIAIQDSILFAVATGKLFFSLNKGKSWFDTLGVGAVINNILIKDSVLFISTYYGYCVLPIGDKYVQYRGDGHGTIMTGELAYKDNFLYTFFQSTIIRTSDNGYSWETVSNGLFPGYFETIAALDFSVATATEGYFYIFDEKQMRWFPQNDGFKGFSPVSIAQAGNYIFCGTSDHGIYRMNVQDITNINESTPEGMMSVTPNPASDYITISLPTDAHTLKGVVEGVRLYDIFGQEATPVSRADTPASGGQVRVDVSALPAGVYFVRVGDKVSKFVKI